jgi:hypothetical protein
LRGGPLPIPVREPDIWCKVDPSENARRLTMKPESPEAGDRRPSGNVIELPCSSASAQVIVYKRTPALAEEKRPPRYLPFLRRAFNAVPPAARLAVGLPLTYIVLTGIFLAWLIGLTVLTAAIIVSDLVRRALRSSFLAAEGGRKQASGLI